MKEDVWILDLKTQISKKVLRLESIKSSNTRWLNLDFFHEKGLTYIHLQDIDGKPNFTNFLRFIKKNFGDILEKIKEED